MRLHRLLLTALLIALVFPAARIQAAPRCFPEAPAVTACIDGRLKTFWEQQGGLPVFGYPLSDAAPDTTIAGAPIVQRFERGRLEVHPEHAPPYDVLLGRVGVEVLERLNRDWTAFPKGDSSAPHFFPATGHAIAPEFWAYWSSHGLELDGRPGKQFAESLALFGMPLSEAQMEMNPTDGHSYLTQWFERARFELHPEHAGTPDAVQLGLLGRELSTQTALPPAASIPQPEVGAPKGGFLEVAGSRLMLAGQAVRLKGVNYYPQGRPWRDMWNAWNGPQIERELRLARDQLGINAIRILLPYSLEGTNADAGRISSGSLQRLREITQIAGQLDIRLVVTLFDFHNDFALPGSREEQRQLSYLHTLIGNFAGDDRIIGWDLHNEPDNYAAWREGHQQQVLAWLGRMADAVHRIAPHHLVTVGMASHSNLLLPGPDGRRVIDYSDIVSVHIYDMYAVAYQLDILRQQTTRPLILEEFGWTSGITCVRRIYNEEQQAHVYRETLAEADGRVAGVFAWTLRDYDPGPTGRWDTHEEHYGLYRPDDSLKPAAAVFRTYAASPLPSIVSTDLPLTTYGSNIPGGEDKPLLVPGSNHYVKQWFRRAWDLLGGQGTFGLPLTEALILPGDIPRHDRIVQFFELAALEYHPEGDKIPNFALLSPVDQVKQMIIPIDVGGAYTAQHAFAETGLRVDGMFSHAYKWVHGEWRLGDPISQAFVEEVNSVPTTVQYFQRGRLQLNPTTRQVELGAMGAWSWQRQCQAAPE